MFKECGQFQMKPGENSPPTGDFMLPLGVPPCDGGRVIGDGLGGAFLASTRIGLCCPSPVRTPNSLSTGEIRGLPLLGSGDGAVSKVFRIFSLRDSSRELNVGLGKRGGARDGAPLLFFTAQGWRSSSLKEVFIDGVRGAGIADRCFSARSAQLGVAVTPSFSRGGRGGGASPYSDTG